MSSEPIADSLTTYVSLVNDFSGKVIKVIPKSGVAVKQHLEQELDGAKAMKKFINANGILNVLQECLDLRVLRASEFTLSFLEKLLINGLIDYNQMSNIASKSPSSSAATATLKSGIDLVLELIIECIGLKEETIHTLVVRCLHSLVLSHPSHTVYGENLEYVVSALLNIYSQSKGGINLQNATAVALMNIANRAFARMERFSEISLEQRELMYLKRCIASNGLGDFIFEDVGSTSSSSNVLVSPVQSSNQLNPAMMAQHNNSNTSSPMPSSQSLFGSGSTATTPSTKQRGSTIISLANLNLAPTTTTTATSSSSNTQSSANLASVKSISELMIGQGGVPNDLTLEQYQQLLSSQQSSSQLLGYLDQTYLLQQCKIEQEQPLNFDQSDITKKITLYCQQTLTGIVDQVIIHAEKKKEIVQEMTSNVAEIPLNCVPPKGSEMQLEYQRFLVKKVSNEIEEQSGKYGWCFVCRKTADFYCKNERVPICSPACKNILAEKISEIEFMQTNLKLAIPKDQYIKDGMRLFKNLCKLASRDNANLVSSVSPQTLTLKVISLWWLKNIMENTDTVFLNNFAGLVKEELVHVVLLNIVSQVESVSKFSFQILRAIIADFRDTLKSEVQMFIDEILVKILESPNASVSHRNNVITLFEQLMKMPRVMLEVFVNYDCHVHAGNLCGNVVELLARIAQGKYTRTEFAAVISAPQELELRQRALQALVNMIKYFAPFSIIAATTEDEADQLQQQQQLRQQQQQQQSQPVLSKDFSNSSGAAATISFANQPSQESMSSLQDEKSPSSHSIDAFASPIVSRKDFTGGVAQLQGSQQSRESEGIQVSEQRKKKKLIYRCCEKFNFKYKEGLKMIFAENLVVRPPQAEPQVPSTTVTASTASTTTNVIAEADNNVFDAHEKQLQESAVGLAEFLYSQRGLLNRDALGSCFADGSKYNQTVFAKYLWLVEMRGLNIVDALRLLFKHIYPPGEAEAMDRIIQQFGQKYLSDNPTAFKNEGVTYTLAFAIMMLQTNLYNKTIKEKEKMTLASFSSLIKGISDGENLPQEQVTEIFNSVKQDPLGIHQVQEQQIKKQEASNNDPLFKQQKFKQESHRMIAIAKQRILESGEENQQQGLAGGQNQSMSGSGVTSTSSSFKMVLGSTYSKEFLECLWSSLFATFSLGLEQYDDKKNVLLCLDGLKFCIVVLSQHDLVLPIEAFVLCLTKNTGLIQSNKLQQFTLKNLQSCSSLLDVAVSQEGKSTLGKSWKIILEHVQMIDEFLSNDSTSSHPPQASQIEIDIQRNKEMIIKRNFTSQIIDKIYSSTYRFDCKAISEFIECFAEVCLNEINRERPHVFLLQRISEVAEFNMGRPRFEWNQIWTLLSPLFEKIGTHKQVEIQHIGVDQLKQISLKFLQKTELAHYSFQRVFLRPFIHILEHTEDTATDTLELLMSCIQNIVGLRFENLKSGWTTIIDITVKSLKRALKVNNRSLIKVAFSVVAELFRPERKLENLIEVIPSLCQILSILVISAPEQIALSSVTYMSKLIDALVYHARYTEPRWIDVSQTLAELWLPTLLSLGSLYADQRSAVQRKGIETLFLIVETHGRLFSAEFWATLFEEVFVPYFEYMGRSESSKQSKNQQQQQQEQDGFSLQFIKDSCQISFDSLVEVFILNFESAQTSLPAMLHILAHSIELFSSFLSRIAVEQTQNLIINIGDKLSAEQLRLLITFFTQVLESSLPQELLEAAAVTTNPLLAMTYSDIEEMQNENKDLDHNQLLISIEVNYERILSQSFSQLVLVNTVKQYFLKYTSQFSGEQLIELQEIMLNSYSFATHFNSLIVYRYTLLRNGFLSESKFPNLMTLQRDSQSVLLLIWIEQYKRATKNSNFNQLLKDESLKRLLDNSLAMMTKLVKLSRDAGHESSEDIKSTKTTASSDKNNSNNNKKKDVLAFIKVQYTFEMHKYVLHLRSLLAQVVLPALVQIPIEEFQDRVEEVMNALIELSSIGFARNLLSVICGSCSKCEACKSEATDSFDVDISRIMKRILAFMSKFIPKTTTSTTVAGIIRPSENNDIQIIEKQRSKKKAKKTTGESASLNEEREHQAQSLCDSSFEMV